MAACFPSEPPKHNLYLSILNDFLQQGQSVGSMRWPWPPLVGTVPEFSDASGLVHLRCTG